MHTKYFRNKKSTIESDATERMQNLGDVQDFVEDLQNEC